MSTAARKTDAWRPLLGGGGILYLAGGVMHPDGPDGGTIEADLAGMMVGQEGQWVASHSIMAVGLALLLGAFLVTRQAGVWPRAGRLLPVAIGATALAVVDMVLHTASVLDADELAAGDLPALTAVHLALALGGGLIFGLAFAALAWRLATAWSGPFRVVGGIGVVAGLTTAASVPVVVAFDSDVLFPIAGITIAIWAVGSALAGLRARRPQQSGATAA